MRTRRLLPVIALLCISLASCGSTEKGARPTTQASVKGGDRDVASASGAPAGSYLKNDGDKDNDDDSSKRGRIVNNDYNVLLAPYGRKANRADLLAVTSVVKNYYAAAAAGDGNKACSMLSDSLAAGFAGGQSHSATSSNEACASTLAQLFKEQHKHLVADDVTTMVITSMNLKGNQGLVALGFRAMPEGDILVERKGSTWKINSLLDSEIP